jgi:3-methyladenine DNA glycosylase AlkD
VTRDLLLQLRSELKRIADPSKALLMQRYMKSSMPYLGVSAPDARRVFRRVFTEVNFENAVSWRNAVLHVWRNARFREEWYAAVALCELKKAEEFQTPDALRMYEEMIVTGAWWDVVDGIATHSVGRLLRKYPQTIGRRMRTWSRSKNLWKRRTSILCQIGFKKDTDLPLLYACIEPSLDSREFFLRKAIGWALRQYAWTDPAEIRRYVHENAERLSPLSKREALKNIG